jgi:hypothetical protein
MYVPGSSKPGENRIIVQKAYEKQPPGGLKKPNPARYNNFILQKQEKIMEQLINENRSYWDRRAPTYTDVIRKNLADDWDKV